MQTTSKYDTSQIEGKILKDVSRSFYLTLHYLPKSVRTPISLAYLLARSTDTVADEIVAPAETRLEINHYLTQIINANENTNTKDLLQKFPILKQCKPSEKILIKNFNSIVEILYSLPEYPRSEIINVSNKIISAQNIDISLFNHETKLTCMNTVEDLDKYLYLIAGCVGEFWTNICNYYLKNYSNLDSANLTAYAIAFGKALQLTNIIRDFPHDLSLGRCYFPAKQLAEYNINIEDIQTHPTTLMPIIKIWQNAARDYSSKAYEYVAHINNRRIRSALTLPLLLSIETVNLTRDESYLMQRKPVKVTRKSVNIAIFASILSGVSVKMLKHFYGHYMKI